MRLAAALLSVLVGATLTGCGASAKSHRRAAVDAYFREVNGIEARLAGPTQVAGKAYRQFGRASKNERRQIQQAQLALVAARVSLAGLHPPREAHRVHRDLLRLADMESQVGLEAVELADFLPLARATLTQLSSSAADLRRSLAGARHASDQATALDSYGSALDQVTQRLDALGAPPALVPWQRDQRRRLQATLGAARQLAKALRIGDRKDLALLSRRLRALVSQPPQVTQAQHDAIVAYDQRLIRIARLTARIQEERRRLEVKLG